MFKTGQQIVIARGTPEEEANEVAGFGSILTKKPTQFDHPIGTPVEPAAPAAAAPEANLFEIEPLLPAVMPLATTSSVIPSYSMVQPYPVQFQASPVTTSYAMPTTSYPTTASYAAPATTSYAMPATGVFPQAVV